MSEDRRLPDGVYRCYEAKRFTPDSLKMIEWIEDILTEYQGYVLTVRQMHYQLVSRNLTANNQKAYDRLSDLISNGRIAGYLPWNYFEDRGRSLRGWDTVSGPREAMANMVAEFKRDLWFGQPYRPEVWVEKQALEGVIGEMCNRLRVDFYASKGYNSQSEQYKAGRRFARYIQQGQTPIVFDFRDLDPSGWDMTRDNRERLELFAGVPITVVRLGLNMDQVHKYNPPDNYVKVNGYGQYADSRAKAYVEKFGTEKSWELDALSPTVIHSIIEENVVRLRNEELWDEAMAEETMERERMEQLMVEQYGEENEE